MDELKLLYFKSIDPKAIIDQVEIKIGLKYILEYLS
jgi:hypothetical protein